MRIRLARILGRSVQTRAHRPVETSIQLKLLLYFNLPLQFNAKFEIWGNQTHFYEGPCFNRILNSSRLALLSHNRPWHKSPEDPTSTPVDFSIS